MNAPRTRVVLAAVVGLAGVLLATRAPAWALITPTYVAATGDDNAACTFAAPCRTLAGALAKTSSGGVINVLDSGEYGQVSISQSVSIIAPAGVHATVAVTSGNGIVVNGSGIKVQLRGLSLRGAGGNHGIYYQDGSVLHVENCDLTSIFNRSIHMEANGKLFVSHTTVRESGGIGITAPGTAMATLTGVQIRNGSGGFVLEGGTIVVRDSIVTNTSGRPLIVQPANGATLHVTLDRITSSANPVKGLSVIGGVSRVVLKDSTITDNSNTGVEVSDGATVILMRNIITGNGEGIYNANSTVRTSGDNIVSDNTDFNVSGSLTSITPR